MAETQVLYSICEYLAYKKDLLFWRNNTIPVFSVKNKSYIKMPKFSRTGLPDIIVIKKGKFIGLEVKTDKGKPSPNQIEFGFDCVKAGGEYYVVRSIEDVQKIGL